MMKSVRDVSFLLTLLVLILAGCTAQNEVSKGQPEVRIDALYPSYTDAEMVQNSEAVILGKVGKKGALYQEDTIEFTEFPVTVIHSFKGDLAGEITVTFEGTETKVVESNPLPVENRVYLMFLRRVPENNRLVLLNGPWSRFEQQNDKFVHSANPQAAALTLSQFKSRFGFKD